MSLKQSRIAAVLVLAGLVGMLLLNACNMPGLRRQPTDDAGAIYTAAAQTVQARFTSVSKPPATQSPGGITPQPPASPTPTGTAAAGVCDRLAFIEDVTIPDSSKIEPGATFVKTWRLRNDGDCTWNAGYALVPVGENVLSAPGAVALTGSVPPGQVVDLSVSLRAPETPKSYQQTFMLRNAAGQVFGDKKGQGFYVLIQVPGSASPTTGAGSPTGDLDFQAQAGVAEWFSYEGGRRIGPLKFGGSSDDAAGAAYIAENIPLENRQESGKILVMVPRHVNDGGVAGFYPAYTVKNGDAFRARIGFTTPGGSCGSGDALFSLYVRYSNGTEELLQQWEKTCDGRLLLVEVGLNRLEGQTVQFVLVVRAHGAFDGDLAVWRSAMIAD